MASEWTNWRPFLVAHARNDAKPSCSTAFASPAARRTDHFLRNKAERTDFAKKGRNIITYRSIFSHFFSAMRCRTVFHDARAFFMGRFASFSRVRRLRTEPGKAASNRAGHKRYPRISSSSSRLKMPVPMPSPLRPWSASCAFRSCRRRMFLYFMTVSCVL